MTNWFNTSLGQSIIKSEVEKCAQLLPSGYYARSMQVGIPWVNYLEAVEVSSNFIIDTEYDSLTRGDQELSFDRYPMESNNCHYAVSTESALPFPEKTHDLAVLPHTLDYCGDPHEVLRQVNQILVPEGCMVIIGFNLVSFYGAIRLLKGKSEQRPWDGHYYRVGRVQDWLSLLGYDLVGAGMMSYQLPLQSKKWRDKLSFVEKAGDRWWPGLGGVYVIVGRKRVMATTALPKSSQTWRQLIPGIAQPAAQHAAKVSLKLVPKN